MVTGFNINRELIDLIRALSASEGRSCTSGVTGDGWAEIVGDEGTYRCEPEAGDYRVTLPDGRSATGSTVANALAAAKLLTP